MPPSLLARGASVRGASRPVYELYKPARCSKRDRHLVREAALGAALPEEIGLTAAFRKYRIG